MFLLSLSLFNFSVDDGGTSVASWLTIASITMLVTTYFIDKLQKSPNRFVKFVFVLFEISVAAILLFVFDCKIIGACTIIFQLILFFVFGFFLFNNKYSLSFQKENITPDDFFS